jgi:hypothetical protein
LFNGKRLQYITTWRIFQILKKYKSLKIKGLSYFARPTSTVKIGGKKNRI